MGRKAELSSLVMLAGFGIFVIYESFGLPYVSEFGPGPGFFPLWTGIGIVVCSLVILFNDIFRRGTGVEQTSETSGLEIGRALGAWAVFATAIALLSVLGFGLSLGLLTAFLILVLDRRPLWVALSVALGLALGFHFVFAVALEVPLPAGPWGF